MVKAVKSADGGKQAEAEGVKEKPCALGAFQESNLNKDIPPEKHPHESQPNQHENNGKSQRGVYG
jgi:hypothetical protein